MLHTLDSMVGGPNMQQLGVRPIMYMLGDLKMIGGDSVKLWEDMGND